MHMSRRGPFFILGMRIAVAGTSAIVGCGGQEFGTVDPTRSLDGSADARPPSHDGKGGGGTGAGGSATGGTGGASGGTGAGTGGGSGDDAGVDDAVDDPAPDEAVPDVDGSNGEDAIAGDAHPSDALGDAPMDRESDSRKDDGRTPDGPPSTDVMDATIDARRDATGDAVCSEPVTYYKDEDGDGFGNSASTLLSCTFPGGKWSVLGGDCRDDLANVKPFSVGSPDPPLFAGTGYADPNAPQGVSFDFDCSGAEQADPSNSYGPDVDCALLVTCKGIGYVPVNPARTGSGIDPRCGSTTLKRCSGTVVCNASLEPTTIPYRCR